MVLPSIADALIVVILLVPGFVAFFIIRRIGVIDTELSELENIIWSVFITMIILIPFSAITGLDDLDTIREKIFLPTTMSWLFGLTVGGGLVVGAIAKQFRKRFRHGDAWENAMMHYTKDGSWITVFTTSGKEYSGKYRMAGISEDKRELIVSEPIQIIRDEKGIPISEIPWGEEMIFTEGDIARIVFFSKW